MGEVANGKGEKKLKDFKPGKRANQLGQGKRRTSVILREKEQEGWARGKISGRLGQGKMNRSIL